MRTVTLQGGTHDGDTLPLPWWQPVLVMLKRITADERQALHIDGVIEWKDPEEVYEPVNGCRENSTWVLTKTVNYKP